MDRVLPETTTDDFQVPDNVTLVRMDVRSGLLANGECTEAAEAAFIKGTEPTEYCPDGKDKELEKFH
jgi:membrane carboxypeptidase/penicillin-binding protein